MELVLRHESLYKIPFKIYTIKVVYKYYFKKLESW